MTVEEHVDEFRGLNLTELKIDQAYVNISVPEEPNYLYLRSENCYKCPFELQHLTFDKVKEMSL